MNVKPAYAMVFSPHPADSELGAGGTVARFIKEGKDVVYVVATNGDKASSDPNMTAAQVATIREQEQREAAALLGVREVIFMGHPDLGLEDIPGLKKELLRLYFTFRPEVVMTANPHYTAEWFTAPDHRVLGRAVLDMIWPIALSPNYYRDLLAEGLEMHIAKEIYLWQVNEPNYYSDISDTFEQKMQAIHVHQSQIGPNGNNPDFPDFLRDEMKKAGEAAGCEWAERFIKVDVPRRL